MARGTWADAVRVREGRRALERRRGDPFVRKKRNSVSARPLYPLFATWPSVGGTLREEVDGAARD